MFEQLSLVELSSGILLFCLLQSSKVLMLHQSQSSVLLNLVRLLSFLFTNVFSYSFIFSSSSRTFIRECKRLFLFSRVGVYISTCHTVISHAWRQILTTSESWTSTTARSNVHLNSLKDRTKYTLLLLWCSATPTTLVDYRDDVVTWSMFTSL